MIRLKKEECVGKYCGLCARVCPSDAMYVGDVVEINIDKCIDCKKCIGECPNWALECYEE